MAIITSFPQPADADPRLAGKTVYVFGDSIVFGHTVANVSCVEVVGKQQGMTVVKCSRNGATILPSALRAPDLGGTVLDQPDEVPQDAPAPDVIVFEGGTNDAYSGNIPAQLGSVSESEDPKDSDMTTFAGRLEALIGDLRRRWPNAKLVFLAVAKLGGPDWDAQTALHAVELAACRKWGVTVANVFDDADLDTRRDADRVAYSFDATGSDGLPGTPQTITYPDPAKQPSGTHPNLPAIERFYAPVITAALIRALA